MKQYLLAATLMLGTIAQPIKCDNRLSKIAGVSAAASIIGAYMILNAEDHKEEAAGVTTSFAGASIAALGGMIAGELVTMSCVAGYGPAVGIMLVTKLMKSMMHKK